MFPIYTVYVHEDFDTRERVFYNCRKREIPRIDPPDDYDPYLFVLSLYGVDNIALIDAFWLWIFDPAHIALELKLVPEVFYDDCLAALEAEQPEPELPSPEEPVTELQVSVASASSGPQVRVEWPDSFTDLIDVYSTTNLFAGPWELAAIGLASDTATNLHVLLEDIGLMVIVFFTFDPNDRRDDEALFLAECAGCHLTAASSLLS